MVVGIGICIGGTWRDIACCIVGVVAVVGVKGVAGRVFHLKLTVFVYRYFYAVVFVIG